MNQNLFDDLAKGLATNRISRGQVLKGLAASLLLAGPLGAFIKKPAFAQTVSCVSSSCTDSAKQAYDSCNKGCKHKKGKKRKQCLQQCKRTLAGQDLDCGCVMVHLDTATNSVTVGACDDPCTPKTLFDQATQDTKYSTLSNYLTSNPGYQSDGSPKAVVTTEDDKPAKQALIASYSNPSSSGEIASLRYGVDESGQSGTYAVVYKDAAVSYALTVDSGGQVQTGYPPEQQGTSTTAAAASTSSPQAEGSPAVPGATLTPDDCQTLCNAACSFVGGLLCNTFICFPFAEMGPGAIAACVYFANPMCSAASSPVCGAICNGICQCRQPDGGQLAPCGSSCCGPCQKCSIYPDGSKKCEAIQCDSKCKICDPAKSSACIDKICPVGTDCCDGSCVDKNTDRFNCGGCGINCFDKCNDHTEYSLAACCQGVCKSVYTRCSDASPCKPPVVA